MSRNESDDRDLQEMFEEAREADVAQTPAFRSVVERTRASAADRPRRVGVRIVFGVAGLVTVALAVVAALFPGLVDRTPIQEPAQRLIYTFPMVPRVNEQRAPENNERAYPGRPTVPAPVAPPAPPARQSLRALGYVGGSASGSAERRPEDVVDAFNRESAGLSKTDGGKRTGVKGEFVKDLPVQGRFYQNVLTLAQGVSDEGRDGNSNVHGGRFRDFKPIVGGAPNQDPFTGQVLNYVKSDSIAAPADESALNTESYAPIQENRFLTVRENPLSTFSIDVDTASYSNVRRFLRAGRLPPRDAVRIEEMLNYFRYDDPAPTGRAPLGAAIEVASCPWAPSHRLARIAVKGREVARAEGAGSNLVFLVDVSGSMDDPAKLPLLRSALGLLVDELDGRDRVAIVVYAGASGLVLPATSGADKATIRDALDRLDAGGSTNGGEGLRLAYKVAREGFLAGGVNRVILATDGDFNVGVTSQGELLRLVESDAKRGIFLTALGFGMGNYKDATLEHLADRGNGNYAYIDDLREARKVLVEEIGGTLVTIAKDVKIQVEFNPAEIEAYRLIGYENRLLAKEDFNDDRKDAGEVGSGHTVTVLYELVPAGVEAQDVSRVDPLKYQSAAAPAEAAGSGELMTLKIRYKEPEADESRLLEFPVRDGGRGLAEASPDFKFASAVAEFGMYLRGQSATAPGGLDGIRRLAAEGAQRDEGGYRAEFLELVDRATQLGPKD